MSSPIPLLGSAAPLARNDKWRDMNAELTTFILKNVGSSEF